MDDQTLKDHLLQMQEGQEGDTPEEPAAPTEEQTKEPEEPAPQEDPDINKSMAEVLGTEKPKSGKTDDSVPLAKYLELKSELAEAKSQEMTKAQESASLKALAEEYDVDFDFVQKLAVTIGSETEKKVKEKYEPFIKEQKESATMKKQNELFDSVYGKVLESNPELADVVNKDVIKALAFDESNSTKSVKQLINEVYGGALEKVDLAPTPTFEKGSTGTRKNTSLDFNNLSAEDHQLIASDPKLKKEYGDHLVKMNLI